VCSSDLDWKIKGLWFPIANLMTHGIIKGKHESVGTASEPLDKFTDDVLLYFARGVSMYELYISPDILSEGEWGSISRSMAWARDRFPILMNTELVGGNPMKGEPYGYTHFKGKKGIIAARNPVIDAGKLKVRLDPAQGLDPNSSSLVLERVYPTRYVSPRLYKAGSVVTLPLEGFETAVYELYPLSEAKEPLLAGAVFDVLSNDTGDYRVQLHSAASVVTILNSAVTVSSSEASKKIRGAVGRLRRTPTSRLVTERRVTSNAQDKSKVEVALSVSESSRKGILAVLITPDNSVTAKIRLKVTATLDGVETTVKTEHQEGKSQWYKIDIASGKHSLLLTVIPTLEGMAWKGKVTVWFVAGQKQNSAELALTLKQVPAERILPPLVWPAGEVRRNVKIGQADVAVGSSQ
jgi:hypothetical protein